MSHIYYDYLIFLKEKVGFGEAKEGNQWPGDGEMVVDAALQIHFLYHVENKDCPCL